MKKSVFKVDHDCGLYENVTNTSTVDYQSRRLYYDFCPVNRHSGFKYMIVVFLSLFALAFLNIGLIPQSWTINASIYSVWCFGPAIGLSTAFNIVGVMTSERVINLLYIYMLLFLYYYQHVFSCYLLFLFFPLNKVK